MKNKKILFFLLINISLFVIWGLSSCVLIKQLETPNVVLENDIASWDENANAIKFEISVDGFSYTVENTVLSKKLENNQTLKVRAIGDGKKFTTSNWSNVVTYINEENVLIKLDAPIIDISNDGIASWSAIANVTGYKYKINDKDDIFTNESSVQLTSGDSIVVKAIGDGINYLDSEYSVKKTYNAPILNPIKLDTPIVSISNDGVVCFNEVANAIGYKYKIDDEIEQFTNNLTISISLGQTIVVKAVGDGESYIDSDYSNPYSYNITFDLIKNIKSDETYVISGVVVSVNKQGFVVSDRTGTILIYKGNTWVKDVNIGDKVIVDGKTTTYAKAVQFGIDTTYKIIGTDFVEQLDAVEINDSFIDNAINEDVLYPEYVMMKGLLTIVNDKYYNISTEVDGVMGSISYPIKDLSSYDGKEIIVKGYFTGVSGNNSYINISANEIYEYGIAEKIEQEYNDLISGVKTEHTIWEVEGKVVDMTATTYNSTYSSYNVKLILDVEGIYIGIYNGQVNGAYPASIEGLEVGSILKVVGTIAEQYTMTSGNYTALIEFSKPEISWDYEDVTSSSNVNFIMINDTHGALTDSSSAVSIGRVDTLIDDISKTNGEYIKIHNGDAFQGSYVCGQTYGLPLIEALNTMEFDCFVLGNHEFDWGIDKISAYKDGNLDNGEADFPFLGANIYYANTTQRPNWIEPYTVIEYGDIRVGVIGVIGENQESSILTRYVKDYNFVNPLPLIDEYAATLRTTLGCDVVVVATHEYDDTLNNNIAALKGDSIIDAIFCAHTHQLINESVVRSDNVSIPVVQNYHKNVRATSVVIKLDENNEMIGYSTLQYSPSKYEISEDINNVILKYSDLIADSETSLGITNTEISKYKLGEYATDAMIEYVYDQASFDGEIDIAIMNTGGVRATIDSGDITKADVFEVFPFNNMVVLVNIDGASLKSIYNANKNYLYVDFSDDIGNINNLDNQTIYQLAIIDYVFESTHYSYDPFDNLDPSQFIQTDIIMRDILIEYLDALY